MELKATDRAWDLGHFGDLDYKAVRKVRTEAGRKRYGQAIGSVIIRDHKLKNVTVLDPVWDGWDLAQGKNGKKYDVGYDSDSGKWVATHHGDWNKVVAEADNEEDVWKNLDTSVGKGTRGTFHHGPNSATSSNPPEPKKKPSATERAKRVGGSPKDGTGSSGTKPPEAGGRRTPTKPSSRSNAGTTDKVTKESMDAAKPGDKVTVAVPGKGDRKVTQS